MKSTTRIEIKFLIPIFLVLSEGATAEDPLHEFYRGPFQAVVRDPSGETVFVDSNRQIYQWKKRRFEPIALVGDPKPHVANAVEDENGDLVLWGALPEGGIQLFASDWTHLRTLESAGLSGKEAWMDREESGAVWVHDDLAWAWRVSGERIDRHRFLPEDLELHPHLRLPAPRFLDVPGKGRWFWSPKRSDGGGAMHYSAFLNGFEIFVDGEWIKKAYPIPGVSSVVLDGDNRLLIGGDSGNIESWNPDTGDRVVLTRDLPERSTVIGIHRMDAETLLALVPTYDSQGYREPGPALRLVSVVDGMTKTLREFPGFTYVGASQDGFHFIPTKEGCFIAQSSFGLVFVSKDLSRIEPVDWTFLMPLEKIDHVRLEGSDLFLVQSHYGVVRIPTQAFMNKIETPPSSPWTQEKCYQRPVFARDGFVWRRSFENPDYLQGTKGKENQEIPIESSMKVFFDNSELVLDSRNRPWLVSNTTDHAAVWAFGKWRTFRERREAFVQIGKEERENPHPLTIGSSETNLRIAISREGRILYSNRNEPGFLLYDGEEWSEVSFLEIGSAHQPSGLPYFEEEIPTVPFGTNHFQWNGSKWELADFPPRTASPWGPRPESNTPQPKIKLSNDLPTLFSLQDNLGTLWSYNTLELGREYQDLWLRYSAYGCPLGMTRRITKVHDDGGGKVWFVLESNPIELCSFDLGTADRPPFTLEWAGAPPSVSVLPEVEFRFRVEGHQDSAYLVYQLDGEDAAILPMNETPFSLPSGMLSNGDHVLRAIALDSLLRRSGELVHSFRIERDLASETGKWIDLLDSEDFGDRERAVRGLVSIGEEAVPDLKEDLESASDEEAWWIRAAIDEIRRNSP